MEIIWKIKEIREKKGISQLKLSSISGVCKSNIGAIEVGTIKKPSYRYFKTFKGFRSKY